MRNRRNSIASKRQSMIKLLSEDEDDDFMTNPPPPAAATNPSSAAATEAAASSDTATPVTEQATAVPDQELTEGDNSFPYNRRHKFTTIQCNTS